MNGSRELQVTPDRDGTFHDRPAEARNKIKRIIPENLLEELVAKLSEDAHVSDASPHTPINDRDYAYVNVDEKFRDSPINIDRPEILRQVSEIEPNTLVIVRYVLPGASKGGGGVQEFSRRSVQLLFAGVVDKFEPEKELTKGHKGALRLKRGVIITDASHSFFLSQLKDGEIDVYWDSPFGFRQGLVPVRAITGFSEVDLGEEFDGFDEIALYGEIIERAHRVIERAHRVKEGFTDKSALKIYPSSPDLLRKSEATSYENFLQWLKREIGNEGEDTYRMIAKNLKEEQEAITARLATLSEEREQYVADLKFTKATLDALKDKQKKAPPRSPETQKVSEDLRTLFKDFGFELSAVNPLFYPYFKKAILLMAEYQDYPLKEVEKVLDIEPERVVDAFPEIIYDLNNIPSAQAVFTENLRTFVNMAPQDRKPELARRLKRLYVRYFHPDTSPFDKRTVQELLKIGGALYNQLENSF